MVWALLPTVKVCWAWVAALQLPLPAWLASMTQEPPPTKVKTDAAGDPEVQTAVEPSMEKVTVRPEVAVAAGGVGGAADGRRRPGRSR